MIFMICLLFTISIFALSYYVIDCVGGQTAFERNRFQHRIKLLEPTRRSASVEKKGKFSEINSFNAFLTKQPFIRRLERMLAMAGWKYSASVFFLSFALLGFSVYFAMILVTLPSHYAFPLASLATVLVPTAFLKWRHDLYLARFTVNFPRALQVIRAGLVAGLGMGTTFEQVAKDCPHPINIEFNYVLEQLALGKGMVESLRDLYKRVPTNDVKTFSVAVAVQQESGGNLVELMQNLEETVNSRIMLRKELNVLTAQARMSGWIIWAIPFLLVLLIGTMNPRYLAPLFVTPDGHTLLFFTLILQLGGLAWILKIINIRIAT